MKNLRRAVCLAAALISAPAFSAPASAEPPKGGAAALAGPQKIEPRTLIVTAEGLADPNSPQFAKDKGILIDALRADARRQAVEKAVGVFVDASTLSQNYALVSDRVLTRSAGLIKQIVKESEPWKGEDGFMHMLVRAEVYVGSVEEALRTMGKDSRIALIKEKGDPRIGVAIVVSDADRASDTASRRSPVAENVLKERITGFGYRVFAEDQELGTRDLLSTRGQDASRVSKRTDFTILGEAKLKALSARLPASGITVTKHALTSYTVAVRDNVTGEEVYFDNRLPQGRSWNDEDQAIAEIGRMVGEAFSKEFFEGQLAKPSRKFQLQVSGLPDYDAGEMLKKELVGLRPILGVDFRSFDAAAPSLFEVEFVGVRQDFTKLVSDAVVGPLNAALGEKAFRLVEARGDLVRLEFKTSSQANVVDRMAAAPPASLASAPPERIAEIARSPEALKSVERINPDGAKAASAPATKGADALKAVKGF